MHTEIHFDFISIRDERLHRLPQILIVDDHEFTRRAVRTLLEENGRWEVCGEASDGEEAVETAKRLQPDLIVMDFKMPRLNGLQVAARISRDVPQSRVLICTLHHTRELSRWTEDLGLWGVVDKQDAGYELPEAVAAVLHGDRYFGPEREDTG